MPACLSKQSKFPANMPISFIFNFFKRSATTLGSRGYFFHMDTDGLRRSRVNEARGAGRKK